MSTEAKICSVPDCSRPLLVRGWCNAHYLRWKQHGDVRAHIPLAPSTVPLKTKTECSVPSCERSAYAHTYCRLHWKRFYKHGDPKATVPAREVVRGREGCKVDGCEKPHRSIGLCSSHASSAHSYKLTAEQYAAMMRQPCAICGYRENLNIDHDHSCCPGKRSCGKCVRGVLCLNCNYGVGAANDDPEELRRVADYLLKHQARRAGH